jgi:hypothetical protein
VGALERTWASGCVQLGCAVRARLAFHTLVVPAAGPGAHRPAGNSRPPAQVRAFSDTHEAQRGCADCRASYRCLTGAAVRSRSGYAAWRGCTNAEERLTGSAYQDHPEGGARLARQCRATISAIASRAVRARGRWSLRTQLSPASVANDTARNPATAAARARLARTRALSGRALAGPLLPWWVWQSKASFSPFSTLRRTIGC